ncbi:acetate--CoA ligase family protein [Chelatococcus asaccharovorans]|uniref:acetate--CoA ligase family protein n=1 Tax=Chelatococcus asaccharovorans TaxID=28210 RepID=UPI00224C63BC|nr:acetate--CoA ligase family protein [Chelatococcus asaccharovorans]CAH1650250.1 Acetyltransferase [Chelatococcus asaccharovorans]CAH1692146.1 Acetyltransferase [Chelatococcus asaccharovorans]
MKIDALLNARSIAIVGASERPSAGRNIIVSLQRMGFPGAIYPINPKRDVILGYQAFPRLTDVPGHIDTVAFCLGNAHLPTAFQDAAEKGVGAAAIYAGGFSESSDPEAQKLGAFITGLSNEAGIALCGPNCMGALSPSTRTSTYLHEVLDPAGVNGNVGLISQSGAICIALASDCRRFGFSHIVSSGNEAVLTTCDFMDYMIADPETRTIALFLESVREPDRFVALLDRAADAGKPVVALKVGKSARAKHSITTHTGGLAGESRVFSAVLAAHRAIEVETLGAMTEVLAAVQGGRYPQGSRLAVMTGSGGQAELVLDIAEQAGFDLPALAPTEREEVESVVGRITGDGNPLDAWGSGDPNTNYPHALRVLGRSPHYDAVALLCDGMDGHPLDEPAEDLVYAHMVADAARASDKPFFLLSTRAGVFRRDQEAILRAAGAGGVLSGIVEGLGAVRKLAQWARPRLPDRQVGLKATAIASDRATINERDAKVLLAKAGVSVTQECLARSLDEATAAFAGFGGAVVLKVASDDIAHKSEYGLVALNIRDEAELRAAWARLEDRLKAVPGQPVVQGMLMQEMVPGGVEVFAGVNRDPEFGLVLAFGLGGTLVEVLRDISLRPLPLRQGDAEAMIAETSVAAQVLNGVRGAPPADIEALAAAIYALADFAWANRDSIDEIDVNPIKVLERGRGCVAVDALIIPRRSTSAPPSH